MFLSKLKAVSTVLLGAVVFVASAAGLTSQMRATARPPESARPKADKPLRAAEPAKKETPKPLAAKELTGTYRGERDGAKVEVVFEADGRANWRVNTRQTGGQRTWANVQADLRAVDDKESGCVELRFDRRPTATDKRRSLLMGRLVRGEKGSLKLTILPAARVQSEHYYQLLEDFPLEKVQRPADAKTTATGKQGNQHLTLGDGLGTQYEGLVIALLGSCSVEGDAKVATKGRWDEASKGDHLRIRFAKPRTFVLGGVEAEVEAEEILVPLSATARPEYIYVRNGDGYRAFAKYEAATCFFIQGRLESMPGR